MLSASSSPSTTSTATTAPCAALPSGRPPNRSPNQTKSTSSTSADETDSAAYSPNTNMPHDLHGRNNRPPQPAPADRDKARLRREEVLGGLINEYSSAA